MAEYSRERGYTYVFWVLPPSWWIVVPVIHHVGRVGEPLGEGAYDS